MRACTTSRRPTSVGRAMPSSTTCCTARSTRSSSPSQYTTRLGASLAAANIGFMMRPDWYTKRLSRPRYPSKSVTGRVATPESIAACATAGAILAISRGSNGRGIR